ELHAGGERARLEQRCEILLQISLRIRLEHRGPEMRLQLLARCGGYRHRNVELAAELEPEIEILAQQLRRERRRPVEVDERRRLVAGEDRAHHAVVDERQEGVARDAGLV